MKTNTERSYRGLLWTLVLVGLVLDQSSKYFMFSWLYQEPANKYDVVPDIFEFTAAFTDQPIEANHPLAWFRGLGGIERMPHVNSGALFGWKAWLSRDASNTVFAVVSVLAALSISYWSTLKSTACDRSLCIALGSILAGTLGNLYDRVIFHGVRDFVRWHYHEVYDWPVFNLADCCLVCGASLLLIQAFFSSSTSPSVVSSEYAGVPEMVEAK